MNLNLQKNLANKLTFLRALLVIPFAFFLHSEKTTFLVISLILLALAAVTDFFDGKIARKRKEVSSLGKFLDPLADKLFICTALILFLENPRLPLAAWPVILIICREFIVNGFRTFASSQGHVLAAARTGKIKTALQMLSVALSIILLIFNLYLNTVYPLIAAVSIYTLYSGVVYIKNNINIITSK